MNFQYPGVNTRFLRDDERLVLSDEKEMPLVIEAQQATDLPFLRDLLKAHSEQVLEDISRYGAVLLRGFDIRSDDDFEKAVLSIHGLRGISEAFMSEEGRVHTGQSNYVLHTNAVYKTGGTLYLGGFHSENYYSTDVPAFISFCCFEPSSVGGETGLMQMEKVYRFMSDALKAKLEKKAFFVCKWRVSEVAERYQLSTDLIETICKRFNLPLVGEGAHQFILMYKPSVFKHPRTQKKSLHVNLFELPTLNKALRKQFMQDYQGKTWFWHRFVWRLPKAVFKVLESVYVMFASFFYSPKDSTQIFFNKIKAFKAAHRKDLPVFDDAKVGHCFDEKDIQTLAQLMRQHYSSCLWKKGDILVVDNRQVMHAGMPGAGPRKVRALICNPIQMDYKSTTPGLLDSVDRVDEAIGEYLINHQSLITDMGVEVKG